MKTLNFVVFALLMMVVSVTAQTNTPPVDPGALPITVSGYWDLLIAGVTPIIVWLVSKVVPNIPKVLLPTLTPFLGIGLGLVINKLAGQNLGFVDMAKAGALAVMIREVFNQAITKQMTSADTKPTG
jgi:hypothetical protein